MTAERALRTVLERAQDAGWAGPDPYDGLLSPIGRVAARLGSAPRMLVTQATLRSSAIRRLLRPPATVNPKGLGLFLGSVTRSREALGGPFADSIGDELTTLLARLAVRHDRWSAWGYPFPWQSRFFFAPAGTPNAVVTATVGWHLLDRAEKTGDDNAHALAIGAARFLSFGLHHTLIDGERTALSYTSSDRARIVNVSVLGARLLARAAPVAGADVTRMLQQVNQLLGFALASQREDGAWTYAVEKRGGWIDSFHTGFILEGLLDLRRLGQSVPPDALNRGFSFYARFFDQDGGGRISTRPGASYDAHSAAQGILTYAALASADLTDERVRADARVRALRIARWSLARLWLNDSGRFAYRIIRDRVDEQDYTRWVQAWMALGMGTAVALERTETLSAV